MSAKTQYDYFKDSGDLLEMNEKATGDWQKDKKWFTILYNSTLKGINQIEVNLDQDYEL